MSHTHAIFGSPGCGKTTRLSILISELARSCENMAVVSFSRQAAGVLTTRIRNHSIRYIGTLHALAFKMLNLSKTDVADERRFADWYITDVAEVQLALSVKRFSEHKNIDIAEAFTLMNPTIPYLRLLHIIQSYDNWKKEYYLTDFEDMINRAIDTEYEPFDIIVVDEAQDLTNKQWDLVHHLLKDSPDAKLYIAGDDDQALFTWAGANPHAMGELADEVEFLEQSYRVPQKMHAMAEKVINQVSQRIPKRYYSTPIEGEMSYPGFYEPMFYNHQHTILVRDRYSMNDVEEIVIDRGVPYTGGKNHFWDRPKARLIRAILNEDYKTINTLSRHLYPKYRDPPEHTRLPAWQKCVDLGTYEREAQYLTICDHNIQEPQVTLSTIHGFKGGEDEHIVLMANVTGIVEQASDSQVSYDDEVRVWYVALTRASRSLTIIGWNDFLRS